MADYPKSVELKNKKKIILRLMEDKDLDSLISFYQSIPESDRLYLRVDVTERKNLEQRFGNLNYDHVYPILATDENKIIGVGTLFRPSFGWTRNVGEIRVVITPEYQRKGLATIFVRELFFRALKAKIHKLIAEMAENQESAIAAFERLGFRKEATLKNHITDLRGRRRDLVIMTLDVLDFWHLIEDYVESRDFVMH